MAKPCGTRPGALVNLDPPIRSGLPGASMDTTMVNGMRLLLSSATLLTLFIDPESAGKVGKIG